MDTCRATWGASVSGREHDKNQRCARRTADFCVCRLSRKLDALELIDDRSLERLTLGRRLHGGTRTLTRKRVSFDLRKLGRKLIARLTPERQLGRRRLGDPESHAETELLFASQIGLTQSFLNFTTSQHLLGGCLRRGRFKLIAHWKSSTWFEKTPPNHEARLRAVGSGVQKIIHPFFQFPLRGLFIGP